MMNTARTAFSSIAKRRFSSYMDYESVCSKYDKTRRAVGSDLIQTSFQRMFAKKYDPLNNRYQKECSDFNEFTKNLTVLDCGCGTGNYTEEIFKFGVGHIYGMDRSEGMLGQSINKFVNTKSEVLNSQSVSFCQNEIKNLPSVFKPDSFDVICINQVLHHLVCAGGADRDEKWTEAFNAVSSILTKNGRLLITTTFPDQLQYGMWHQQLVQNATDQLKAKHGDMAFWEEFLPKLGFKDVEFTLLFDSCVNDEHDLNFEGLFDAEWRGCDSLFGLVKEDELQSAQDTMRKILDNSGEKKKFIDTYFANKEKYGQTVFISAVKQ